MRYEPKTKPYKHQVKALKQMISQGYGGALLLEPRTGKSKTTIDYISAMNQAGKIDRVVIVSPNRIMGTWIQEFHRHCPRIFKITVWDAKGRKLPLQEVDGSHQLHVVLVNYEAFATPGKKTKSGRESKRTGRWKTRGDLRKWLNGGKSGCMVLDESHKIKSPSGRAANMIVSMSGDVSYRLILTGTPLTKAKRAHDIYMQWKFLNPERFSMYETAQDFKNHFGRWKQVVDPKTGREFPKYLGPANVKELQYRMAKDAVIVRREDCFDLPPREDIVIPVKLKASRKHYEEMAQDMITMLEDGREAEATIKLVQQLRLTQITSGFVTTDEGEVVRVGFEKSDALKELLDDMFEKDQKVVVAARWKADLDLIAELGEHIGFKVWSIRGGVKRTDSDKAILDFRDFDGPGMMVIQPQAASMGIDLSTASTMIWYSATPSWVDFSQSCDRIALSRTSTTFYHLLATQSVDEILMETLRGDGDVARAIMTRPTELLTGHHLKMSADGKLL